MEIAEIVERMWTRRIAALVDEASLDAFATTLSLPSDRVDRRSITNTWYLPLAGARSTWEERVTIWVDPPSGEPSDVRVQHGIVLPKDGVVERGWVAETKTLLDAWSERLEAELHVKPQKIGARAVYARPDHPSISVSRSRLGNAKAWHVVSTEVSLRPRS